MAARNPIRDARGPRAVSEPEHHPDPGDWSDLGARVASGLILGGLGVAAAFAGGSWLAGAAGAAVAAMSYEWARMSEPKAMMPAFWFALAGALGAVMFASWRHLDWGVLWLCGCAIASALRRRSLIGVIETAGGLLYVGAPAAIFLWFRSQQAGLEIVLSLFAIIWSTDVAAYFGGKLIGGPRIARGLSPNKTWSGIASGTLIGAFAGLGCAWLYHADSSLWPAWALVGAAIAFIGLMGDLFESFLKRRFGVKDASRFIPGHGGVLDRIDGLMAASIAVAIALSLNPGGARALIGGGL